MPLINLVIFGLASIVILLKLALGITLMARGLARSYPMLTIYAAGTFGRGVYLASHWYSAPDVYGKAYGSTEWIWPLLTAGVTLEAFWGPARSLRRFRPVSNIIGAIFTLCAGVSALAFSGIAVGDGIWAEQSRAATLLLARNFSVCCATFLFLTWMFYRQFPAEWIKPNARLYLEVLLWLLAGEFACRGLIHAASGSYAVMAAGQILNQTMPAVCLSAWIWKLRADGEGPADPVPLMSPGDYRRAAITE